MEEGRALSGDEAQQADTALDGLEESADQDGLAAAFAANPLLAHQRTLTGRFLQEESEAILCNKTGLQATFLHTQTAPGGLHVATSFAVRTIQSVWLFECGEDTQRGLLGHPLVDWKRIDRVFLGSMTPEAVLGVPGMLCMLSASREKGHENADYPVHVYGPPGLVAFVSSMLSLSRTYLEMPVILHEFTPKPIPSEALGVPVEVVRRSRLYGVQLPPDQLNPEGFYDGRLTTMLSRHTRKRTTARTDFRSGALPQNLPPPGDPSLTGRIPVSEMTWTVRVDGEWLVKAAPLRAKAPALGYVVQESDRAGRLYPEVAAALGVSDKEAYTILKEGSPVTVEDGSSTVVVRPEQCVGPPRPGRRIAVVPPCSDSRGFAAAVGTVDLVVHAVADPEKPGAGDLQVLSEAAGKSAAAMEAQELVLWQPFTSFLESKAAQDCTLPLKALEAARQTFGKEYVIVGGSYQAHHWDRPEGGRVPPELPPELAHLITSE